ncbi:MAG: hypothetical protein KatS3mg129_0480 [Leptospiraceae bacterium]|nr:MAG: hypothetical protein KatS3mg129_0480 [Leptospiraceae bacterium]
MKLYLVRHAQAGDIKTNYDVLSENGIYQAKQLGKYFKKNKLTFDLYVCGTLNRQKETLSLIKKELQENKNEIILDSLDEISEDLFKSLLQYYIKKDKFLNYLFLELQKSKYSEKSKEIYILILKNIFKNWILDKENPVSFFNFKNHVLKIYDFLNENYNKHNIKNIIMVSSGTPIAILLGNVFHLEDSEALNWMKKIYNTSLFIFNIKKKKFIYLEPISINFCPHLLIHEQTLL